MVQQDPPLLRLPADLRLIIYEYTFAGGHTYVFESSADAIHYTEEPGTPKLAKHWTPGSKIWSPVPGLLLSAKQIYQEAVEVYWNQMIFVVIRSAIRSWLRGLKDIQRPQLRSLHLDVRHGPEHPENRNHTAICLESTPEQAERSLAQRNDMVQRELECFQVPIKEGVIRFVHHDCQCPQWPRKPPRPYT